MKLSWIAPPRSRFSFEHETIWPVVAGLVVVGLRFLPELPAPFPPLCLFHLVSGLPCPGCGGTRAVSALSRLEIGAAFAWNPLVASAAAVAALFSLYAIGAVALRTRRLRMGDLSAGDRLAAVSVVLGNWMYLIAVGR